MTESEYSSKVRLLILQILLQHQQSLVMKNKDLDIKKLLVEPVIDIEVMNNCQSNTFLKLNAPTVSKLTVRNLRFFVEEWLSEGIPNVPKEETTIITLANYYYSKRIKELEEKELPTLRSEAKELFDRLK